MPSGQFTGIGLELESLALFGTNILRLKFTQDPLRLNPLGANDALNVSNYTLTGTGTSFISAALPVPTDPQSVDLVIGLPLHAGLWTLSVANIETAQGDTLGAPTSMDFTATAANPQQPVAGGATNDGAIDVLKKHMGGGVALEAPGWDSFLAGVAAGDQYVFDTAAAAFNQRFLSTASDIYLGYLGSARGVAKPPNLGMSDDLYRQLVLRLTNGKLTEESFLELLEIFYGIDSVHGQVTTANPEPFPIADGDTVTLLINERSSALVTFTDSDFQLPGVATAVEVAAAMTRNFEFQDINAFAVPITDAATGDNKVRVYSAGRGLRSAVRCLGGSAQNIFQFPSIKILADTSATWNVDPVAGRPGVCRFMPIGPTSVDLSRVIAGDYVNVYGPNFNPSNRGTYTITNVSVFYEAGVLNQFFDVVNPNAVAQSAIVIDSATDLAIFQPTKAGSFSTAGRSVTVSSGSGEVDIVIPATTQAVHRTLGEAAYLQIPTEFTPTRVERFGDGTVRLTVPAHGVAAGATGFVDGVRWNGAAATINAGTPATSGLPGLSPSSYGAGPLPLRNADASGATQRFLVNLSDGRILIAGGAAGTNVDAQAQVMTLGASGTPTPDGSTAYTYNYLPATPITWTGRDSAAAAKLIALGPNTGKVLFVGGATNASTPGTFTASTDLFDPSGSTFAAGGSMSHARGMFGCDTLATGNIIVSGGSTSSLSTTATNTTEIYSVSSNTWASAANMLNARVGHTLTTLQNGAALAAGGLTATGYPSPGSELYDPTANAWSPSGDMNILRQGHTAVLLPSGAVLVLGGHTVIPGDTRRPEVTPEIYDPVQGAWYIGVTPPVNMQACIAYVDAAMRRVVVYSQTANQVAYFDYFTNRWSLGSAQASAGVGTASAAFHPPTGLEVIMPGNVSINTSSPVQLVNTNNLFTAATGLSSGGLNGIHLLAVPDGNTLQYQVSPGAYYISSNLDAAITIMVSTAMAGRWQGPFSFDTQDGPAITATVTTATALYTKNGQFATLDVADTSSFPDTPGYLCVGFGYEYEVSPVPYLGVLNSTQLILDFRFKFTATTPIGASVTLLASKGPYVPTSTDATQIGNFYLTESAAGRLAAKAAIASAQAAGVSVNVTVTYPGDRGLGAEGLPDKGSYKVSDIVEVFAGDEIDTDLATARTE